MVVTAPSQQESEGRSRLTVGPVVALIAAHVLLAMAMDASPAIATAHALATFVAALVISATTSRVENVACAAAYVCGSELLWRVTDAVTLYEFGKYALMVIVILGLIRFGRLANFSRPAAYMLLLLPSAVFTVDEVGVLQAREALSFNLSGPAALALCVFFFSQFRAPWAQLRLILWSIVAPITGLAAVTAFSTVRADLLQFSARSSNFVTSGGFGPNQVSAVLGLGALLAFILALREQQARLKLVAFGLTLWMLTQATLTFSRGGVVNLLVSVAVTGLFALRQPRYAIGFVALLLALVAIGGYLVYPRLEAFTGGTLQQRFSDRDLAERTLILDADLEAWRENFVLGAGPGVGKQYRYLDSSAHTEFTRLLAEHGLAGLLAMAVLVLMVVKAYRDATTPFAKMWVVALGAWTITEMTHGAMRFAAISFVFGLMTLGFEEERAPAPEPARA